MKYSVRSSKSADCNGLLGAFANRKYHSLLWCSQQLFWSDPTVAEWWIAMPRVFLSDFQNQLVFILDFLCCGWIHVAIVPRWARIYLEVVKKSAQQTVGCCGGTIRFLVAFKGSSHLRKKKSIKEKFLRNFPYVERVEVLGVWLAALNIYLFI